MANVSSSNGLEKRPKLRFPGFDEPWEENELSHYLVENTERNRGLAFGKEDVLSVSGEYGVINQIAFQGRSFAGESVADYHVVETDDIVYTKSPLKANPYGIIKVNKGIPGIVSTLYAVYHPLNTVAPRFVDLYFANNLRLNKFLKPLVNIGAKHDMKVNNSFVLTGTVVFPSIGEQQKLVDFFAKLDRRIEAQRKIVEALKKYKRGLVNDIFSQRIVPYGERDEWTILPFREVVTINPKTGPLPDEFIYLDLECVNSGKVCAVNIIKRENAPSRAQRLLEKNDVLYQMVRPYQQNNYYYDNTFSSPVVASTGYAQIKCGACDPLFVYEQISSERFAKEAMLRSTGTSYPAINADDLGEIPFFLPSTHIQKKIGAILSLVNQKIFKSEEELQLLKSTKSSLLQQLFI